jgi:uncharacterized protein (TIGR00304 family)
MVASTLFTFPEQVSRTLVSVSGVMRSSTVRWAGLALFLIGLVSTAWAVYAGLISFDLVVIVPVLTSTSALGALPLLTIFAGILLMAIGPALGDDSFTDAGAAGSDIDGPDRKHAGFGGVVLIGPIPIIFGSDKRTALIAAAIAIVVLAALVLLLL